MKPDPPHRSFLIAVDDSETARRAVDYVGALFGGCAEGVRIVLLHIVREPEVGAFRTEGEGTAHLDALRRKGTGLLIGHRARLVAWGIPEHAISTRCSLCRCASIAEGILTERDALGVSTVVLGRHHLTRVEEFLYGSVSGRLVAHASECAIWVIA
jgi:nucleotide-binding universal stress UspA family protein